MKNYRLGIDVGSTTVKIALIDFNGQLVFSFYRRHFTKTIDTLSQLFDQVIKEIGNVPTMVSITGSAGMGISEKTEWNFVQEVMASAELVKIKYPTVRTMIDIGGEDSKMIFFNENKPPDIRMNGNCAGGTGAFIDQVCGILNIQPGELNQLAQNHTNIYSIASRCGVFAKTDIQNLLSRKIHKEDIAASVFHALAIQTMNNLARGFEIKSKVILTGGPFSFLSELRNSFIRVLKIHSEDVLLPHGSEIFSALGAAFLCEPTSNIATIEQLKIDLQKKEDVIQTNDEKLNPLFQTEQEYLQWSAKKTISIATIKPTDYIGTDCFLGIDSGSTTTKIVLIGENHELLFSFYRNNNGNSIETVSLGLNQLKQEMIRSGKDLKITQTAVTGYGEDLIKNAFGIDYGMVETIAHFTAAKHFDPKVSFILDIGGQDMKAIFINDQIISRIELNEACSSGCGSFIENFANSLGYKTPDFALLACKADAPYDLGTRCTVFMNSKVKQALRQHVSIENIASGLSYSVIKNCLYKVLKIKDMCELGSHIVVQGGTFKNASVLRAMEVLTGQKIICSNSPELMGAYGCALYALKKYRKDKTTSLFIGFDKLQNLDHITNKQRVCKGCENNCTVTEFDLGNESCFYSGNKCERYFNNKGEKAERGFDMHEFKYELLFSRTSVPKGKPILKLGIPRVMNIFENYPFWCSLLTECGFEVILSSPSTTKLYEKGLGTVMSDNICFPAKLAHGHVVDLTEKGVDRIFYPMVFFESKEFTEALNTYNCPIVSGYPDVIKSSVNTETRYNIPFDSLNINFKDEELLKKACLKYLKQFGIKSSKFEEAFKIAISEEKKYKNLIKEKATEVIKKANENKRLIALLAGRPYHIDYLISQKTSTILSDMGVDVITEDSVDFDHQLSFKDIHVLSQWAYPNRIYKAAKWVADQSDNVQFIHLNSFGCGPDAIVLDETIEILKAAGKNHTHIRIDEMSSSGSIRLRLRSMLESLKMKQSDSTDYSKARIKLPPFEVKDKNRLILAPNFSHIYSPFIPSLFEISGYKLEVLPESDKSSVEYGLMYSNNEICFPAIIVIGDIIRALKSGKYNLDEVAIGITQTGGQCRASSYLSLINKAMISVGFKDVPVISVSSENGLQAQPGFVIDWKSMLGITFTSSLYADSVAKMFYATVSKEKIKGTSKKLLDYYIAAVQPFIVKKDTKAIQKLLKKAVVDFNAVEVHNITLPKVGIVGEIFQKYNSFANNYLVDWLIDQGIEVVIPPLLDFFTQWFVNVEANHKAFIDRSPFSRITTFFLEQTAERYFRKYEKINSDFKFYTPFHRIKDISKKAEKILHLTNQFGEGWLIPAEVASFAEDNINYVISLQPFGCIANHIISKGIEKRIKDLYPEMNLLFLDFEAGTSEVNVLNRLHFITKSAKESAEKT